jgi:imidazolonepropionase-like amidohydrolase
VGSIDVGKDADLVIWNSYPLSSFALADQVFIDGEKFFDRSLPGYGLTHVQAPTAAEVQQ